MTYNKREPGVFHCDSCPEHIETEIDDFAAALEYARGKGWRAYVGPDKLWAHSCPDCVADHARRR